MQSDEEMHHHMPSDDVEMSGADDEMSEIEELEYPPRRRLKVEGKLYWNLYFLWYLVLVSRERHYDIPTIYYDVSREPEIPMFETTSCKHELTKVEYMKDFKPETTKGHSE